MQTKLSNAELQTLMDAPPAEFPKYATQLLNLANQNAQGTRPKVVGQQTELIQQFPGRTVGEWQEWYLAQYPEAMDKATDLIYAMIERLRETMALIDRDMTGRWVRDLVLVKTFVGLRFQEAILRKVAAQKGVEYRLSTTEEEAQGIDGYVGDVPVSIKPDTYKTMSRLPETIAVGFVFYSKRKDGLVLEYDF